MTATANHHWIFACCLCADKPTFEGESAGAALIEHLEAAHGRQRPIKVRRQMTAHMDACDWFQTDNELFDLDNGALIATESLRLPRRGANKALWNDDAPRSRKGRRK